MSDPAAALDLAAAAPASQTEPVRTIQPTADAGATAPFVVASMTGFGSARGPVRTGSFSGLLESGAEPPTIALEVSRRSVNHRYLKLSWKLPESLSGLERDIEARLRRGLSRGAVQVVVRAVGGTLAGPAKIDREAAVSVGQELAEIAARAGLPTPTISAVLAVPGVVSSDTASPGEAEEGRRDVLALVDQAIAALRTMRQREGEALAADLALRIERIQDHIEYAAQRAPEVSEQLGRRLVDRVGQRLRDLGLQLGPETRVEAGAAGEPGTTGRATASHEGAAATDVLAREIALLAERTDITEEIIRLRHHAATFLATLRGPARSEGAENDQTSAIPATSATPGNEAGRKLEFIAQELLREVNTIGSKANDAALSSRVVEMKAEIDRIKEQIQNVE